MVDSSDLTTSISGQQSIELLSNYIWKKLYATDLSKVQNRAFLNVPYEQKFKIHLVNNL